MRKPLSSESEPRPEFMVTLGLLPPYTVEDVKRAYFEKARGAHPDGGGSVEAFVKLHDAYVKASEFAGRRTSHLEWLSDWVEQYAEQQQITDAIYARGGTVEVEKPRSVTASIGPDFGHVLERLVGISLRGPNFTDSDLGYLVDHARSLRTLRSLDLSGSRVTDQTVRGLTALAGLERVDLRNTAITAAALAPLLTLPKLRELRLAGTGVSLWRRWRTNRWLRHRSG